MTGDLGICPAVHLRPATATPAAKYCLAGALEAAAARSGRLSTTAYRRTDGRKDIRGGACSGLANHVAPEPGSRETTVLRRPDSLGNLGRPRPPAAQGSAPRPRLSFVGGEANGLPALPMFSSAQPGPCRFRPLRVTGRTLGNTSVY